MFLHTLTTVIGVLVSCAFSALIITNMEQMEEKLIGEGWKYAHLYDPFPAA